MPAITATYGIKPWEIDLMTYRELTDYVSQMPLFINRNKP